MAPVKPRGSKAGGGRPWGSRSEESKSSTVSSALCLLACLVFALAAVASGLDRQSLSKPSIASRIPWPFASVALQTSGQANLVAGRLQAALADGEAAVRADPIDPVSSALLGSARLGLNDLRGAETAFRIAGQMGWRVPLTQAYWMSRAVSVRDYPVAAMRLDALLRQHPWMLGNTALMASLESSPEGRKAIADRLAARPLWLLSYASEITDQPLSTIDYRAAVLGDLAQRGVIIGCDAVSPPVNRLSEAGRFTEARKLWRDHCPEAGSALLGDPDLAYLRTGGVRSYFEWEMIGSADVSMAILPGKAAERTGDAQILEVHNSSQFTRQVLRQMMLVPPGTYQLSWLASDADGKPSTQIIASASCNPVPADRLSAMTDASNGRQRAVLRIGTACLGHWLAFSVLPGGGDVRLGSIRLEPLR